MIANTQIEALPNMRFRSVTATLAVLKKHYLLRIEESTSAAGDALRSPEIISSYALEFPTLEAFVEWQDLYEGGFCTLQSDVKSDLIHAFASQTAGEFASYRETGDDSLACDAVRAVYDLIITILHISGAAEFDEYLGGISIVGDESECRQLLKQACKLDI